MNFINYDPRIDKYINKLPEWQRDVCKKIRELIHEAESEIVETIKRTNQPYFTLQGNVCALQGTKDHVNVFIYDPVATDPEHIINQGQGNLTARAIQMYKDDTINEQAFINLIKVVVSNNRAGGWRNLQKEK
jgi:hypothetical protein